MGVNEWLESGVQNGYCSEVVRLIHDGTPDLTDDDFDSDECIYGLRIYPPAEEQ